MSPFGGLLSVHDEISPVILSGGSGSRLWPMSRAGFPKQFQRLTADLSMIQETALRVSGEGFAPALVVTNEAQRFLVAQAFAEIDAPLDRILLEPSARNTAPALAAAALYLHDRDPDAVMLALPSDHAIARVEAFRTAVVTALPAARAGRIVTFGIRPDEAHTGYGYIEAGVRLEGYADGCSGQDAEIHTVARFTEKPDAETARGFLEAGRFYWNSGMFMMSAARLIAALEQLAPDVLAAARAALTSARSDLDFLRLDAASFAESPSISIDYAVMERTDAAVVLPIDVGWSDVGSWQSLWRLADRDNADNALSGDVIAEDVRGSYLRSDGPLVAALGLENVLVVATDDAVLAAPLARAEEVKLLVDRLKTNGRTEHDLHTTVHRPWGSYRTLSIGERFQVKEIVVSPGASLSLQSHRHRAEHWVVVDGTAWVTRDDDELVVAENESVFIPLGARHRLSNRSTEPLRIVEVQSGSYLGEDDIVRYEDVYGRSPDGK